MTEIIETTLPITSIASKYIDRVDYFDAFKMDLKDETLSAELIYKGMFSTVPEWVEYLMKIRNKVVSLFGLKSVKGDSDLEFKVGNRAGMFHIYFISENEVIAGEDDRHLNFRVSVLKGSKKVTVTTLVKYHNWFGKFYMTLIKPFHNLIVQIMMKNYLKKCRGI